MSVIQEIPANATFSIESTYRTSSHFNEMIAMLSGRRTGDPIKDKWIDAQIEMYVGYEVKLSQLLTTYQIHVQPAAEKPEAEKPWYPDDSGEWVEVVGGQRPNLPKDTEVRWLTHDERARKKYTDYGQRCVTRLYWSAVCAYKVAE